MDEAGEAEYLPDIYVSVRDRYPGVADALDALGRAGESAGPLADREQRLATLGIAIGALAKGPVRSNVRKALGVGATPDEIRHVAVLAITTTGFPSAVAASREPCSLLERVSAGRHPRPSSRSGRLTAASGCS